jgi:hypothetical protein
MIEIGIRKEKKNSYKQSVYTINTKIGFEGKQNKIEPFLPLCCAYYYGTSYKLEDNKTKGVYLKGLTQ